MATGTHGLAILIGSSGKITDVSSAYHDRHPFKGMKGYAGSRHQYLAQSLSINIYCNIYYNSLFLVLYSLYCI